MSNIEIKMELAKEAVELIKEFGEEASIVGDNPIKSIEIKENGAIIEINHEYDGLEEYQLSKISSIFLSEMRGLGPCSAGFYEAISLAEGELEYEFKRFGLMSIFWTQKVKLFYAALLANNSHCSGVM